jgi:hypothetical protein
LLGDARQHFYYYCSAMLASRYYCSAMLASIFCAFNAQKMLLQVAVTEWTLRCLAVHNKLC